MYIALNIELPMQYQEILKIARRLRKNQTPSEYRLWQVLRAKRLNGIKFLRQHPIIYENNRNDYFFFVADFYCARFKLVIELDGKIHNYQKERDQHRELILKDRGLKMLRIKNEELNDMEKVKRKILEMCQ